MSNTLTLKDGTKIYISESSTMTNIAASFDNFVAAINYFYKLTKANLESVTITTIDNKSKTYSNRMFGSFIIESSPETEPVNIRFSLIPSPAPKQNIGVDEAEFKALQSELYSVKAENAELKIKAQGYDIITDGEGTI